MLGPIRHRQFKNRIIVARSNTDTQFNRTTFAESFFLKLEQYFEDYDGPDLAERVEPTGHNLRKRKNRVHNVELFRSLLCQKMENAMDTAEEAYVWRITESVVDDRARKTSESALSTLSQIAKKQKCDVNVEADNAAGPSFGPSSVESSPASATISDIDYESFETLNIEDFLLKMKELFLKSTDQFSKHHQKLMARDLLNICSNTLFIDLNPLEFGIPIRARAKRQL